MVITPNNEVDEKAFSEQNVVGKKRYELINHLGNVLTVISDKRIAVDEHGYTASPSGNYSEAPGVQNFFHAFVQGIAYAQNNTPDGLADYYIAEIISSTEYSAYGVPLNDWGYQSEGYRYGYNGKEIIEEVNSSASFYDYEARMYDSRIGRWLSIDPYYKLQPGYSPFKHSFNNPIYFIDTDGNTEFTITTYIDERNGSILVKVTTANKVMTDGKQKLVKSWFDIGGQHKEFHYYHYTISNTVTIHKDGTKTVVMGEAKIEYDWGVQNTDYVIEPFQSAPAPGTVQKQWFNNNDGKDDSESHEVWFGFNITGIYEGARTKDWSKVNLGNLDLEWLQSALLPNVGWGDASSHWELLDQDKLKHILDSSAKGVSKGMEAVDAIVDNFSQKPQQGDSVIIDYIMTEYHDSGMFGVPPRESQYSTSGEGVIPQDTINQNYKGQKNTSVTSVKKK